MSDLIIIAHVRAKPGHEKTLVEAQKALCAVVRQQPGCIQYELHEAEEQPGEVFFVERWRDRKTWENHMRGTHMDAFRAAAGNLIGAFELTELRQVA